MSKNKLSAGLLLFRRTTNAVEVFLVHPGGPFWARKDDGAWSIPKGEYNSEEDPLLAAQREFKEETGFELSGQFIELHPLKQPSGKVIVAWAVEGDCDPMKLVSNTFPLEWPARSGLIKEFPEIDRAAWFPTSIAKSKIIKGQVGFIQQLEEMSEVRSFGE